VLKSEDHVSLGGYVGGGHVWVAARLALRMCQCQRTGRQRRWLCCSLLVVGERKEVADELK
jgi:hypothetical protein